MVKKGDRIELIYTDDKYTTLKKGDQGVVTMINEVECFRESQICVNWDNGSSLMLISGKDQFNIINKK